MALNRGTQTRKNVLNNLSVGGDIVKEGPEQTRDRTWVKMTRVVPCLRKELGGKSVKR